MINKVEVIITILSQGKIITTIKNHRNYLVKILMN